ncbi:MAG: hypothetical protein PSW75_06985, partial [bacterium]|nr:hypothetical protein [bacterium]
EEIHDHKLAEGASGLDADMEIDGYQAGYEHGDARTAEGQQDAKHGVLDRTGIRNKEDEDGYCRQEHSTENQGHNLIYRHG